MDLQLKELRANPVYLAAEKKMNDAIYQRITGNRITLNGNLPATPVVLPVVVHIISDNQGAITDAAIESTITKMNEAFSKTGAYSGSKGADTKIQFTLAKKDPNGLLTSGITRVTTGYGTNFNRYNEEFRMKNLINWDPNKYINIWVVNNIIGELSAWYNCGTWMRRNIGGFASMPFGIAPNYGPFDGIVVSGFGIPLWAHEMGHYLGLYHTFEGGCMNNNCLTDGDRVCDTPPDGSDNADAPCNNPNNSCTTDTLSAYSNGFFPRDTIDQISNFMDYSNPTCQDQFTEGQAERMHAALITQRPGLLNSAAVTPPCNGIYLANFTRDKANPQTGETINFSNTNPGITTYEWSVNDIIIPGSTSSMSRAFTDLPAPPFNKHKVTLKVTDGSGCSSTYTDYIITNCGLTARFSNNKRYIASLSGKLTDTILFTNNSMSTLSGTPNYSWILINNNQRDTIVSNVTPPRSIDLNYEFPEYGNFTVRLIASQGSCQDSIDMFIPVADPREDAYMSIISANCLQDTKVRVSFYVCNFGYTPILPGLPVSFYDKNPALPGAKKIGDTFIIPDSIRGNCCGRVYLDTLDIGYEKLDTLFAVANNVTSTIPIVLPDPGVTLVEKDYTNNTASHIGFAYKAIISSTPAAASAEPGDTLRLNVQSTRDGFTSVLWSPADSLSCTNCPSPLYYVDTNAVTQKRVIIKNNFQCSDTSYLNILVPPYNDYTAQITQVSCSPQQDSLFVDFTVNNLFKRGTIPKNLKLSFYNADPLTPQAVLFGSAFTVPDSVKAKQKAYRIKIKKIKGGNIFVSVNDPGSSPAISTGIPAFIEKDYSNNISSILYAIPAGIPLDTAICNGLSFRGHTASGTYRDTIMSVGGCDSIAVTNLTVKAAAATLTTVTITICEGGSYAGYTTTGTYVDAFPGSNTCDSVRTLHLTVHPTVRTTRNIKICKGQTYFAGGKLQTTTGVYRDTAVAATGCDSIMTTHLEVDPLLPIQYHVTICRGNSHFATGKWLTESGVYTDTVQSSVGCDSITITTLTVQPIIQATRNISICRGNSFFVGGKIQTQSGTYRDTVKTAGGCDSVSISILTVQPMIEAVYNVGICRGDSYFAGGKAQTQTGTYYDTTKTANGCDSVTVTNLKVHPLPSLFLPADTTLCLERTLILTLTSFPSVNWSTGGNQSSITVTQPGTYSAQVVDRNGCIGTDDIKIEYIKCIPIQVPGAFTPNNDGKNDTFRPLIGVPPTRFVMQVFNRFGQLLFETHDPGKGWDGKMAGQPQAAGTYVYSISVADLDGVIVTKKGTLILIR